MHTVKKKLIILFFLLPALTSLANIDEKKDEDRVLFHLERNRDDHRVYYELNLTQDGLIKTDNPITSYWIKGSNETKHEPLTGLQERYGYGVKITKRTPEEVRFHLAAYPKRSFRVIKSNSGYVGVIGVKGEDIPISRLYVHFKGMSYWNPIVERIDVYGYNSNQKEYLVEQLIPNKDE